VPQSFAASSASTDELGAAMRALMWFRSDLRVEDNLALHQACAQARRGVVAVFMICPDQWREHDWADIRVEFILRTLIELQSELHKLRISLLIVDTDRFDDAPDVLFDLARRHECDTLFYNRELEVNETRRDRAVTTRFEREGLAVHAFHDQTVIPPGAVRTGKGDFYTVFSPFKRAWIEHVKQIGVPKPLGAPRRQSSFVCSSDDVPERVAGFDSKASRPDVWPAGERHVRKRLRRFTSGPIDDYGKQRDFPDVDGTSCLSPYLTVGAISIRQCLAAGVNANNDALNGRKTSAGTWISELIWREFYRHILVGFPRVCMNRPFREETDDLDWRSDTDEFAAWCEGRTGVPIVDAAMRQLLDIGWMHNRLRMIVAMFLTKDLLIDWRWGERFFMRHLIDGDLASNNGGWQWSASTGTDAAPYFRIFNPYSQSRKFDPEGSFIRGYVPELETIEGDAIHEPHAKADLFDGSLDYPAPIVDHREGRDRAIAAFKAL
jgi:deoxyribodipyrimidine photo-lyase